MKTVLTLLLCSTTLSTGCVSHDFSGDVSADSVIVNGRVLEERELANLESIYGQRPQSGRWWYDGRSGLFGPEGGAAVGFMFAGHDLGLPAPNASGGTSEISINGRRLTEGEVKQLAAMTGGYVFPGSFWLDSAGNIGAEGHPAPLLNLDEVGRSSRAVGGARGNFWSSRISAGNSNASNTQGYVSVPGYGPVGYGY